jgi:hypothetical protein
MDFYWISARGDRFKRQRRLVRDYERCADHGEVFIYIAMISMMTKHLVLSA